MQVPFKLSLIVAAIAVLLGPAPSAAPEVDLSGIERYLRMRKAYNFARSLPKNTHLRKGLPK